MNPDRRYLFIVSVLLAANLWLAFVSSPAWALDLTLYELTDESHHIEGCYSPCMCPLFLTNTLVGSFTLGPGSQEGDDALFEVWAIDWQFIQGDQTVGVTGSGLYRVGPQQHRLILDLVVAGAPVQQFDSGLVPVAGGFPGISIQVALNGFFCYDYVYSIAAQPAAVELTKSTWGSLKTNYR